jgi:arginase family enzyme
MKIIAVDKSSESILSKVGSFLTEDGQYPVVDIVRVDKDIYSSVKQALAESDKTIILGNGDTIHECFKACSSQNPGMIIFSASPNIEFLKKITAIKRGNLLLVGVRNLDVKQLNYIRENKIRLYPMKEIALEGIREISDSVMAASKDFTELYVSIDLGVVDPSAAPGVSFIAPGGFSSRELLFFIHRLKNLRNLKIADIVGLNLEKDSNNLTLLLAAKIVTELY